MAVLQEHIVKVLDSRQVHKVEIDHEGDLCVVHSSKECEKELQEFIRQVLEIMLGEKEQ